MAFFPLASPRRPVAPAALAALLLLAGAQVRAATSPAPDASRWSIVAVAPVNTNFQGMTIGPDRTVWTVDYYFGTLDRFTPDGRRTTFPLGNFFPTGIAFGVDGNFWINGESQIVRATPRGKLTSFAIPSGQLAYGGIIRGPRGDVWFTEESDVGAITPDGVVTDYPSAACSPAGNGIATGADGRLWFGAACPGAPSRMFALDPANGKLESWAIASSLRLSPAGIVAGPDGALWFTSNQNGGYLGRITTHGKLTRYHVLEGKYPAYSYAAQDIAVGPDRHVWYVRDLGYGSIVDNIDPFTLRIERFVPPPGYGRMNSIIAGPDGRMWLSGGNAIYAFRPK